MNIDKITELIHNGKAEIKAGFFIDCESGFKVPVNDSDRAVINMRNDVLTIEAINDLKKQAKANRAAIDALLTNIQNLKRHG